MLLDSDYGRPRRYVPAKVAAVVALALGLAAGVAATDDPFVLTFDELAPGVWVGIRENSPRPPVVGNTVFVVSEDGVIVFDGGAVPLVSERVIAKIREVTDRSVTHVIISHWHGDHNLGISRYLDTYPNVVVVGHEFTRAAMLGSPMDYARNTDRVAKYVEQMQAVLDEGVDDDGQPIPAFARERYRQFITDAELVDAEYKRARITPPTLTFTDRIVIHSGSRTIELRFLGDANTAGDIVMWLPGEKLVVSGDMVVLPTPYGYNVPPRRWAQTLRNLEGLGFETLVPGHGAVQHDGSYVDLLIETAEAIADQRDILLAEGVGGEEAETRLDYSPFIDRYTHGDSLLADRFDVWFARPFGKAAFKELTGEPMVVINPSAHEKE